MLRNCLLTAGFPESLSAHTISGFRCCGLQTAQDIATQIRNGSIDIGIAMGADRVEQGRDALSLVDDVSLSPSEAVRPCESTHVGELCESRKTLILTYRGKRGAHKGSNLSYTKVFTTQVSRHDASHQNIH